ncbi:phosphatidylinositol-specific phospholipase C/glycerophosphodiester phosphodiesterase family protein [Fulvivirgaceae bacterium BMA10]|uniref:Altered inheritance of mitochondria protein 6 n=1 Tax=Splendidivirga corallicola TaxID=3051826 RepID=A0ABT8KVY8_9BACT|nr:phosphatidylinositol-specific phospholipase C/glycerophosphodiester phosphodiesterase family protein [Fulvivirgaceae bacterium BMA10]
MQRKLSLITTILSIAVSLNIYGQEILLHRAHAHNDYENPRPLKDAIELGFASIEVDVHLIGKDLYVSHKRPLVRNKTKTLRKLYLDPLKSIYDQNNGRIYKDPKSPLYLMIDIKSENEKSYVVLKEQLEEYKELLKPKKGTPAVVVYLSGNRPLHSVMYDGQRLASIDGRPEDLQTNYANSFMPIISQDYRKILGWSGHGDIPSKDMKAISDLVDRVHDQNKKLRLWGVPEQPQVWEALLTVGVDFISTDKLQNFHNFLKMKREENLARFHTEKK